MWAEPLSNSPRSGMFVVALPLGTFIDSVQCLCPQNIDLKKFLKTPMKGYLIYISSKKTYLTVSSIY